MSHEVSLALRRLVADRAYRVCEYCLVHEDDLYHGCEVEALCASTIPGVIPGRDTFAGSVLESRA